jgi:glycine cleavage system aminomethyltransferase T
MKIDQVVPPRGAHAYASEKDVGWITSAMLTTRGPLALGYLHRDAARVAATVDIDIDGHRHVASVTAVVGE